jgi:AAA15 family ATPase/GTPase
MKKQSDKTFDLDFCEASIKTFAGHRDSMLKNFRKGKEAGSKTYVRDMDHVSSGGMQNKMWSWKAGEFNLWTGYNNEGKSQFLIFLCVLKAINEGGSLHSSALRTTHLMSSLMTSFTLS